MKKATEYEVQFVGMTYKSNRYVSATKLAKWGFTKHMLVVEKKVAQRAAPYSLLQTIADQHCGEPNHPYWQQRIEINKMR